MARGHYIDTDPNIAVADQNRARAIDLLRAAERYVLIVSSPADADAEGMGVLASADGEFLLHAVDALTYSIDVAAAKIMVDEAELGGES